MATNVSSSIQTIQCHSSDVTCCDFGKTFTLASGSSDKTVRAWEWVPGKGYTELPFSPIGSHTYGVTDAKFSPQGTMLATSSIDGSTVLWNIRTGCRIHTFVQPNGNAVRVCRFTPDSTQLVTAGDDGTICIWNLAHRSLARTIRGHEETVQALSTSPDSMLIASGCSQGVIHIWDMDGNQLASQDAAHDMGVTGADFCPIQQPVTKNGLKSRLLLATCGHDHLVKLWTVKSGKEQVHLELMSSLTGHSSTVLCVRFSPSGNLLASGSLDKTLRVWEMSGKCIKILEGHSRYIASCAFSRDGTLLASGSNDKSLKIWDLTEKLDLDSVLVPFVRNSIASGSEVQFVKQAEEQEVGEVKLLQRLDCGTAVNGCHFAPGQEGCFLAAATGDEMLRMWQQYESRFKEVSYSPIEAHRYSVNQVEFSPDSSLLSSCSLDGVAALWHARDGRRSNPSLQSSGAGVRTCRFSPDGHWVVTGGDDEKAIVWDMTTGTVYVEFAEHSEAVAGAAFSPDSRILATGDLVGAVRIWSLIPSRSLAVLKSAHDLGTQSCDFSPTEGASKGDQYLLASGGNDSMVKLWRVKMPTTPAQAKVTQLRCLEGHGGNVTCVRFAPSGQLLASTASDKTARVWNVSREDCLFVLETHSSIVTCCSFSNNGALMATGSLDKSIIVWELPKEILIRSLAEERLKEQRPKLADWTAREISRWLVWVDLPEIPRARLNNLPGSNFLELSATDLAKILGLDDKTHINELERQLFWLHKEETHGRTEEMLSSVPHELLCPITQELLKEPVLCADGFTYERAAIDEWFLSGKITSPMTNLPLPEASYVPNIKLRSQICSILYGDP